MKILESPDAAFRAMAFNPDGRWLASGHENHAVRVWDIASGKEIARTQLPGRRPGISSSPNGIVWTSDGQSLAVGMTRTAQIWEVAEDGDTVSLTRSRTLATDYSHQSLRWQDAVALPNKTRFLCRHFHLPVLLNVGDEPTQCHCVGEYSTNHSHRAGLASLALHPDGHTLAIGNNSRGLIIWDHRELTAWPLDSGSIPSKLKPGCKPMKTLSVTAVPEVTRFNSDGSRLIVAAGRSILVWDTATWKRILKLTPSKKQINSASLSPNGEMAICAGNDREIRAFDVNTGRERSHLGFDIGPIRGLSFAPDGLTAAAMSISRKLVLWDVE